MKNDLKQGYDVVVIGAGPAGCNFAHNLDNKSILIVDYNKFPRDKACGGMLVNAAKEEIKNMNPVSDIFSIPRELDIIYEDWDNGLTKKTNKGFYNIDRKRFDEWLYTLTEKKNVDFLENSKLVDYYFSEKNDHIVSLIKIGEEVRPIISKYLIGCDGAFSDVRKKIYNKKVPYYLAIQEELVNSKIKDAYFIFDNEITDYYSWIIPKGNVVLVGSALKPQESKIKFTLFKNKVLKKFGGKFNNKLSSALLSRPDFKDEIFLGSGNVLLCGEASGLISPSSGEGISFALKSGKYCAEAISENYDNALKNYKNKCKSLVNRIAAKIKKSNDIKTPEKRLKLIEK